jgi:hypothetical protein
MARAKISQAEGKAAIEQYLAGGDAAMATRYLLQVIEHSHPGGSVELRVPPFGAVQCLPGLEHRRGTPPNVVELDPDDFIGLCLGRNHWEQLSAAGKLLASGTLANNLQEVFPLGEV